MAKLKVSELVAATATNESDELYIVQSGTSKKISVGTFFADISNPSINGNVKLSGPTTTLEIPGEISLHGHTTKLHLGGTPGTITIPNGANGQIKVLLTTFASGGSLSLASNIAGGGTITFNRIGDTATLMFLQDKWYFIGGTANVHY